MLVDICMKINKDSLKGFQVKERTRLRRDLVMVKVPREMTKKYKSKTCLAHPLSLNVFTALI